MSGSEHDAQLVMLQEKQILSGPRVNPVSQDSQTLDDEHLEQLAISQEIQTPS